jgi:hypothetical protein
MKAKLLAAYYTLLYILKEKQNEEWLTLKSNTKFFNFGTSEYLVQKSHKDILRRNPKKTTNFL